MGYAGKIEIEEQNHLIGSALYGISSTAGAIAEKIVTLPDFDTLVEGITIKVKFLYSNTAANPTLNVNGTGALPIYRHGVTAPGTSSYDTWAANAVLSFTYDGTAWRMEEPFDLTQIQQAMCNAIYPVGSIYMSVNSTSPSSLFGGTWVQLKDRFLLAAGDSYAAGATGGEASHILSTGELPSHAHSVGAHSHGLNSHVHGLNSHVHSVGAHSHGLNNHTHGIPTLSGTAASAGGHSHTVTAYPGGNYGLEYIGGTRVGSGSASLSTNSGGAHTHSVTINANISDQASGSTANSSAFNTGAATGNTAAASGNTANSTAFNTGNTGSGTAHNNMPPYQVVYMWKRTG